MSLRVPVNAKDHAEGSPNAPIVLVEYGDYQCPYCGMAYREIKEIQKTLGDDLKFVFRNFPLISIHKYALDAAIAAEIAGEMGKFWEMHDLLYQNQNALSKSDLTGYAEEIGLDTVKFESMLSDIKYDGQIEEEIEGGLISGVNGTPSFFINGKKYEGDYTATAILEYMQSLQ